MIENQKVKFAQRKHFISDCVDPATKSLEYTTSIVAGDKGRIHFTSWGDSDTLNFEKDLEIKFGKRIVPTQNLKEEYVPRGKRYIPPPRVNSREAQLSGSQRRPPIILQDSESTVFPSFWKSKRRIIPMSEIIKQHYNMEMTMNRKRKVNNEERRNNIKCIIEGDKPTNKAEHYNEYFKSNRTQKSKEKDKFYNIVMIRNESLKKSADIKSIYQHDEEVNQIKNLTVSKTIKYCIIDNVFVFNFRVKFLKTT
jgi:hypothetical protein